MQELQLTNQMEIIGGGVGTWIVCVVVGAAVYKIFFINFHRLERGESMKKKGMLIFTFLMLLCNTLTMYYVNRALKQEINIYVVQVGRYKEKANAENIMKQIEELGYKSSMYQDQEYVVITDIFIKQKEAHQQAKEIAEKGNTCVVKEYFIDDRYQEKIEKKEYNAIYQFLKTN